MAGVFEPLATHDTLRARITPVGPGVGDVYPAAQVVPAVGSMADYALATGNVVVSPDVCADTRFADSFLRNQGVRAALVLPLWNADCPIGLLGVFRSRAQEFMLDEVWCLERIADALVRLVAAVQQGTDGETVPLLMSSDDRFEMIERLQAQVAAAEANEQRIAATLGGSPADFRVSPRHDYPYYQKIAPLIGNQRPTWDDFVDVQCGDLSGGGISIWLSEKPSFREMIVALGRPPSLTHFAARVVHVRKAQRAGRTMYQVGCQFLRRVYL